VKRKKKVKKMKMRMIEERWLPPLLPPDPRPAGAIRLRALRLTFDHSHRSLIPFQLSSADVFVSL